MQIDSKSPPLSIRLLTHNIRYATSRPFLGEEFWSKRAPRLLSELRFNTRSIPTSFICLQEVLHTQLLDILHHVPCFSYIGVGRDDGETRGEYSPILYRDDVWELLWSRNVWLSETPEKPSKGWDASSTRILTMGRFKERGRGKGKGVVVLNTHLDDQGSKSRYEAAKIIDRLAKEVREEEGEGVGIVLSGDFNSEVGEEAYEYVTGKTDFMDIRGLVEENERYGDEYTFTGFKGKGKKRIDFVFVRNESRKEEGDGKGKGKKRGEWEVEGYAVLENKFEDGVYNSDHRAVVADLLLH